MCKKDRFLLKYLYIFIKIYIIVSDLKSMINIIILKVIKVIKVNILYHLHRKKVNEKMEILKY
jgi:hypothetical protein